MTTESPDANARKSHKSRGPIFFYSPRASGVRAKKIKGRLKYFRTLGQADDAGAPHARTHFQPQVAKVISDETRSPDLFSNSRVCHLLRLDRRMRTTQSLNLP